VPWQILIVDDHAIVRRMLKVLVETHAGWEVCAEAENGQDALAKIAQQKPDLVIMDMAMPVKDGLTASREISAAMPDVPILMHTLHYSPELELEAKKSGVRKVVPKAESGDGLLHAIAELLEQSSMPGNAI
jgi:DNA-binding NarL/FixJ family response regulator